jgi:hypothetical protein
MPVKKMGKKAGNKTRSARPSDKAAGKDAKWNGISSEAVEKATGKPWSEWLKLLDIDGAAKLPHKEIATHIRAEYGVGDWWCQMVTVGYEQARGLRVKHQTATGYIANISRTFPVSMKVAFNAVADEKMRGRWLKEAVTVSKATPSKTVRMVMNDGSRVVVGLSERTGKGGETKTVLAFQHEKLKDADAVKKSKEYWAEALGRLEKTIC